MIRWFVSYSILYFKIENFVKFLYQKWIKYSNTFERWVIRIKELQISIRDDLQSNDDSLMKNSIL